MTLWSMSAPIGVGASAPSPRLEERHLAERTIVQLKIEIVFGLEKAHLDLHYVIFGEGPSNAAPSTIPSGLDANAARDGV